MSTEGAKIFFKKYFGFQATIRIDVAFFKPRAPFSRCGRNVEHTSSTSLDIRGKYVHTKYNSYFLEKYSLRARSGGAGVREGAGADVISFN